MGAVMHCAVNLVCLLDVNLAPIAAKLIRTLERSLDCVGRYKQFRGEIRIAGIESSHGFVLNSG